MNRLICWVAVVAICSMTSAEEEHVASVESSASPLAPTASGEAIGASVALAEVPATSDEGRVLREGTRIENVVGHFRMQGERLTFHAAEPAQTLATLENLALERIAKAVSDTPKLLEWSVSGTITEYRGSNYLLVTQAQLRPSVRLDLQAF